MARSAAGTLVDTNVWIDILNEDLDWAAWSGARLAEAFERGPVHVNQLIFAELLTRIDDVADLERTLGGLGVVRSNLPWEAAWLTSRAYLRYRRNGGVRSSPMPDFYIGAHAAVAGFTLLTRDARRYREYFRNIDVIFPPDQGI